MLRIRNILRYIIAIALNVFIMITFHSYVNFVLLVGMVLFPIYSISGVCKIRQQVKFSLRAPVENMTKGGEFVVHIVADNPVWQPLVNVTARIEAGNTFYHVTGTHELNIPLRAHGKTYVDYPIVMERCGHFVMKISQVQCMDMLGIYQVTIPMNVVAECIVLPSGEEREQEANSIYQKGVTEAMESKEKGYDFSDISGIREYIPGDKLQNIHWKLSSKKEELMVKERVSVSAMQLHVVVELVNNDAISVESILQLTDSITRAFVRQNLPFTVHYYSTASAGMQQMYIGSEIERIQWLELLLYDVCYTEEDRAENLFRKEYMSQGGFLYIGPERQESGDRIPGTDGTAAVLLQG